MAEVYLAKDVLLDRKIAIKVLRKKFLDSKTQLEQFKREARSAARLIHPSIVTIYDVCDEGDISYILMEYVEGVSLKSFEEQNGRMDPALKPWYRRSLILGFPALFPMKPWHLRLLWWAPCTISRRNRPRDLR